MIERLGLKNFLTFEDLTLNLSPLTLLTGTNSAGKSSLVHALAMLRQSYLAAMLPHAGEQSWLLNGDLVQLGNGRDVLHSAPSAVDHEKRIVIDLALTENGSERRWVALYKGESDVLKVVAGEDPAEASPALEGHFQYLSADRLPPAVTYPKSHEAVSVRALLGSRGEHSANFLRVHGNDSIWNLACAHPQGLSTSFSDQTNAWLNQLSNGTGLSVRDVPGTDFVSLAFDRQGPDVRTEWHRATNVGFGLSFALPVIIGCLAARADSTLIVENPEAHLHPAGQAMLGTLLAKAAAGGAQVIVETHSDHVLNAVRLAVKNSVLDPTQVLVHFFSRTEATLQPSVESISIGADGTLPMWPRGFFDEWDSALNELLS